MMMEWYDQMQRDMRLAGRTAFRHATFTAVVIVCAVLGVGAAVSALSALERGFHVSWLSRETTDREPPTVALDDDCRC